MLHFILHEAGSLHAVMRLVSTRNNFNTDTVIDDHDLNQEICIFTDCTLC